jgi:hypothetical protein
VTEVETFAVDGVLACCSTVKVVPDVGFFSTHEKMAGFDTLKPVPLPTMYVVRSSGDEVANMLMSFV